MHDFSDWTDEDILLDSLVCKRQQLQRARDEGTISRDVIVHMLSVVEQQLEWALDDIALPSLKRDIKK